MAKVYTSGVSTLGITFGYGVETTAGTKPDSFTLLHRINDIGEVTIEPEAIDSSALEDLETKYVPGRSTVSDAMAVTVNKTDETIAEWKACIEAYNALTEGKRMWFQTITPGIKTAEFVIAAPPSKLPISAKGQNELSTMVSNLTIQEFVGDDAAVEMTDAGE